MRHLFVDTFYLIALAHPKDQWRERVLTFSRSLRDYRLYTVDEVLAEFLTACSSSGPRIRQRASQTVRNGLHDRQGTAVLKKLLFSCDSTLLSQHVRTPLRRAMPCAT
jgi:hypothetical protein